MTPLIVTTGDRSRLFAEAKSWIGTPYAGDGAIKGAGVSCALLPYEILRACGHSAPKPPGRGDLPKISLLSAIRSWLDGHAAHFVPVARAERAPGDVILVEAGIGHLLLVVDANDAIQCLGPRGAQFVSLGSTAITKRNAGVWRPIREEI